MQETLDQDVINLSKAIRQVESGGNFTARGKSGEYGAYQFTKDTWKKTAPKYGVAVEIEQATPEQQNEVAYRQIKEWKDAGYNPGQIASMWNSGKPDAYLDENYKGTNKYGANYDVPAYAKSVATAYHTIKSGGQPQQDSQNPSSTTYVQPQQPEEKPGFFRSVAQSIAQPFESIGQGLLNELRQGTGLEGGVKKEAKGFFGNKVDPVGYRGGQELGAGETAKQFAGNVLQGVATVGTPTGVARSLSTTALGSLAKGAKIGGLLGGAQGLGEGLEEGEDVTSSLEKALKGAAVGAPLGAVTGGLLAGKRAATPNSEEIMQRVARVSKSKQASFEQTAGESVGQYLDKRGIYGDVDQITRQLFERFTKSKQVADDALAKIQGTYKAQPVKTALTELQQKVARTSSPGAPDSDLGRVLELVQKEKTTGLNMSEINEVKRLYERRVRLDFIKENAPESVTRATNIDNALRQWQFNEAEKAGLKNLPDINRETRLAKKLLDDLGQEYAGQMGNNAISLTDWVALSGGDLSSALMFLTKKGVSNKKIQSYIAKTFSKNKEKKGLIEADFNLLSLPPGDKTKGVMSTIKVSPTKEKDISKGFFK
ncbi:hypothetical protein E6Q11_03195 [Candidatus Dojkabacteria bacterium]|uniref:Resuscitation-promoting factor core lysozyme-like domain-containing protein n=1 Tax=Candidatus Dojkabacteria bacterium TaxID=2099670 RepID=A0A5C7J7A9_9BACT|nr:MAG: hypothetical protein E6Q11_03195 [Candidatus Dojkabacteria bacterium]